ncbi:MAG: IS701 family transposase [Planctomycetota bacterium]|jgi:SRSO17 transposase
MGFRWLDEGGEARFAAYVERLSGALRHADRVEPFRSYCTGLLLPGERKSVEPMAARLRPARVSAEHQSLLHFVGQSPWDETALLRAVREAVLPAMTAAGPVEAWIVDDTGFPKKGRHSVGVARQYCGELGKQDNCQVAVSLSVATAQASLPVAWRLYLPESWAGDRERCGCAGVPQEVAFQTKPQIALAQIRAALAEGVAPGTVLVDAGYGNDTGFRVGVSALGLDYVVGVVGTTTVWPPGMEPAVPAWRGRGRRPKRLRRAGDGAPVVAVRSLAEGLAAEAWQEVTWREGTAEPLRSRFAALRVRPAHREHQRSTPRPEEWLLVEWPEGEAGATKFWLSSLPTETPIARLVSLAKLRWLIERDYLELKQELGLGHYEGRGWRGFHHHGALCIAAYGFLVAERSAIPPSASGRLRLVQASPLPQSRRPRGAATQTRTPRPGLDRHPAPPHRSRPRTDPPTLPMLRPEDPSQPQPQFKRRFMTQ